VRTTLTPAEILADELSFAIIAERAAVRAITATLGRIRYSMVVGEGDADDVLVYIKPARYGDGRVTAMNTSRRARLFPHESTEDQFFSESQFESYRMLGGHTMEAPDWLAKFARRTDEKKGVGTVTTRSTSNT
jgi:hypothetical protein